MVCPWLAETESGCLAGVPESGPLHQHRSLCLPDPSRLCGPDGKYGLMTSRSRYLSIDLFMARSIITIVQLQIIKIWRPRADECNLERASDDSS